MPIQLVKNDNSNGAALLTQCIEALPASAKIVKVDWVGCGFRYPDEDTLYLNKAPRINNLNQLAMFRQHGIVAPVYATNLRYVTGSSDQWWGRMQEHTQAKDIVDQRMGRRFVDSQYWVKVIPDIVEEWRIHIVWGRRIARGLKVQVGEPKVKLHKFRRDLPIRNRIFGWHMRHDVAPSKEVSAIAKKAVAALGYDFGAVDVYVRGTGEIGVFEVNKVPGVDESTAQAYANAFQNIAIGKWKRRAG